LPKETSVNEPLSSHSKSRSLRRSAASSPTRCLWLSGESFTQTLNRNALYGDKEGSKEADQTSALQSRISTVTTALSKLTRGGLNRISVGLRQLALAGNVGCLKRPAATYLSPGSQSPLECSVIAPPSLLHIRLRELTRPGSNRQLTVWSYRSGRAPHLKERRPWRDEYTTAEETIVKP
jgi:hypothetical protein